MDWIIRDNERISTPIAKVYLEPLKVSDAPLIYLYTQDPEVYEFMPWEAMFNVEEAQLLIEDLTKRRDLEIGIDFGVYRKEDDLLLGVVSLSDIKYKRAEIGYWLARKFWGKGYMYQALVLLISFAFERLRLHRLFAKVSPRNTRSRMVLLRLGFTYEGTLRDDAYWKGAYHTHEVWALLSNDPRPRIEDFNKK